MRCAPVSNCSPERPTLSMRAIRTCRAIGRKVEAFMPVSAFLLGANAAARIASLNVCTDEYMLLLARSERVASVSYLSHDPLESSLWREARRHPGNRGSIEDVLTLRPTLVLTMGGVGGRATGLLAARLNIRMLELPY